MDKCYPWDMSLKEDGRPWHITENIDAFMEYITKFGIPDSISLHGNEGLNAAKWLVDTCMDLGHRFPKYTGSTKILEYIDDAKIKGQIYVR
jgi:hypothetical protein